MSACFQMMDLMRLRFRILAAESVLNIPFSYPNLCQGDGSYCNKTKRVNLIY